MAWAMFCSSIVLPVRGGATIRARWPLPCGAIRSMTRAETSRFGPPETIFSRLPPSPRDLITGVLLALAGASAAGAAGTCAEGRPLFSSQGDQALTLGFQQRF